MADANLEPPSHGRSDPAAPFRLGLLVDSLQQPAWVARALSRVLETGIGTVALVVRNEAGDHAVQRGSRLARWWTHRERLAFAAYERLDRPPIADGHDPFRIIDLTGLLGDAPAMSVVPRRTRLVDFIEEPDVARIREASLDVLLRLGFRILRGGILGAARFGVWSYHHGDNHRYRGGPPGFWEVMEDNPATGTILQRLTDALDDGEVLYRSWSATNRYSVVRNRQVPYWTGAEFLERVMRRLRDGDSPQPGPVPPSSYSHRLYVAPSNTEMAAGLARLAWRRLQAKWDSLLTREQWFLAYHRRKEVPDANEEPSLTPYRFRELLPPPGRFWADPFPLRVAGRDYILFEDYPYDRQKGVISLVELDESGNPGPSHQVLERECHLSYPFVFSWKGEVFLMPESADASRVEVFRATRAPFEWRHEATVMEGISLVDCTLAQIGDRWWMFANAAVPDGSFWDELHVFHGPSPLGPWTAHRANPVVSDVRCARPAGRLFQRGGRWYRPAQDCSRSYGHALTIREIMRLDTAAFEERTVARLSPDWRPGITGVHTVNASGGLTVIDVRRRQLTMPWLPGGHP